ncbi:response regulator transcription factor [Strepomyces sp. STD 3.1]|nr:response regulator transcription factor [Streptomyces sp. STD 3.1]
MNPIRVVLIEDDLQWLNTIQTIISEEKDMELVGYGTTREEAVNLSKNIKDIDIFLIDINLTEANLDGIYAALDIKNKGEWKVIMLTCLNDKDVITKAFTAGAVNYILKKDVYRIADIIRTTHVEDFNAIETVLEDYRYLKYEQQLQDLTPTERLVYELAEEGLSRSEIQKRLFKSDNTIKNQIRSILRKLSVSNVKSAITKVRTGGLK